MPRYKPPRKPLKPGEVYGGWTIVKRIGVRRGSEIYLCRCSGCNGEFEQHRTNLVQRPGQGCRECGLKRQRANRKRSAFNPAR